MFIRLCVLSLLSIASPATSHAQEIFQCSIDAGAAEGQGIEPVSVDVGNGTFLTATTWIDEPFGSDGIQLTAWRPDGRVESSRVYRGGRLQGLSAAAWNGSRIFAAGIIDTGYTGEAMLVLGADRTGEVSWSIALEGDKRNDRADAVVATRDGGVLVVGTHLFNSGSGLDQDLLLVRVDGAGRTLWADRLGSDGRESGSAVAVGDGGFYVAGNIDPQGPSPKGFVGRLGPDGSLRWFRSLSTEHRYRGIEAAVAHPESGVVVGGWTGEEERFGATIAHVDSNGTVLWAREFGHAGRARITDLVVDTRGDIVALLEWVDSASGSTNLVTARFRRDGTALEMRRQVGLVSLPGSSIEPSGASLLVSALQLNQSTRNADPLVMRSDSLGSFGCDEQRLAPDALDLAMVAGPFEVRKREALSFRAITLVDTANTATVAMHCSGPAIEPAEPLRTIGLVGPTSGEFRPRYLHATGDGYAVLGTTSGASNTDVARIELEPSGMPRSGAIHSLSGSNAITSTATTREGGSVVAGYTLGASGNGAYVTMHDPKGSVRFSKALRIGSGTVHFGVAALGDGGALVSGPQTDSLSNIGGRRGYTLLRFDSTGAIVWGRSIGTRISTQVMHLRETGNGDIVVAGSLASSDTGRVYVARFDRAGSMLWSRSIAMPGFRSMSAFSIHETSDRALTLGGELGDGANDPREAFLIRLAADGTISWARSYGGDGYDYHTTIVQTGDGDHLLAGYRRETSLGGAFPQLVRVDTGGAVRWSRRYGLLFDPRIAGTVRLTRFEGITESPAGNIVALGTFADSPQWFYAFALLHLSPTGEAACSSWVMPTVTHPVAATSGNGAEIDFLDAHVVTGDFLPTTLPVTYTPYIVCGDNAILSVPPEVEVELPRTSMTLSPNPVRAGSRVTIVAEGIDSRRVRIHTILGEDLHVGATSAGAGRVTIETEGLAPGVYMVAADGVVVRMMVY